MIASAQLGSYCDITKIYYPSKFNIQNLKISYQMLTVKWIAATIFLQFGELVKPITGANVDCFSHCERTYQLTLPIHLLADLDLQDNWYDHIVQICVLIPILIKGTVQKTPLWFNFFSKFLNFFFLLIKKLLVDCWH